MPNRSPVRRPSWILAAILFAVGVLGFGPLVNDLTSQVADPIQPVGDVVGAVRPDAATPRPTTDGATGPAALPSARPVDIATRQRPQFVDSPPGEVRPLAPHALRGYAWPLPKGRLTLGFRHTPWGSRLVDGERFHDGIDLATFCGDRILAAHSGVVLAAGRRFDDHVGWVGSLKPYYNRLDRKNLWQQLPLVVVIDDENGYRSVYAHFSKVVVRKGQRVEVGQLIGYEGQTGRASGCHLHYGLFSPLETARMRVHPDTVKRMKLPRTQVARVNPLVVLPPRRGDPQPELIIGSDRGSSP